MASALLVLASLLSQRTDEHDAAPPDVSSNSAAVSAPLRRAFFKRKSADVGGVTIFVFRVVQVLAVFALLGLSIAQLVAQEQSSALGHPAGGLDIVQVVQCALFVSYRQIVAMSYGLHTMMQGYLSVLGVLSLFGRSSLNGLAYTHLSWILVLVWSTYVYRDVWPLLTVDLPPADAHEGPFLWAKLSLLSIAGIIIPVFVPRKYTPVNPKVGIYCTHSDCDAHIS